MDKCTGESYVLSLSPASNLDNPSFQLVEIPPYMTMFWWNNDRNITIKKDSRRMSPSRPGHLLEAINWQVGKTLMAGRFPN